MKRIILAVYLVLWPCLGLADLSGMESPPEIADRLQKRYEALKSISFHFSQDTSSELGGRPKKGSGDAYFLRRAEGGKMRWNYAVPDRQVLVSDGEALSMYFAKLNQMIISDASAIGSQLAYSFFTGTGNIAKDFIVSAPDAGADHPDGRFKVIKLVPREAESQIQDIHLWVTDNSLIQRMEIRDHFNTVTTLNLSKIRLNPLEEMDKGELDRLFTFTPPENTEIIRQ